MGFRPNVRLPNKTVDGILVCNIACGVVPVLIIAAQLDTARNIDAVFFRATLLIGAGILAHDGVAGDIQTDAPAIVTGKLIA